MKKLLVFLLSLVLGLTLISCGTDDNKEAEIKNKTKDELIEETVKGVSKRYENPSEKFADTKFVQVHFELEFETNAIKLPEIPADEESEVAMIATFLPMVEGINGLKGDFSLDINKKILKLDLEVTQKKGATFNEGKSLKASLQLDADFLYVSVDPIKDLLPEGLKAKVSYQVAMQAVGVLMQSLGQMLPQIPGMNNIGLVAEADGAKEADPIDQVIALIKQYEQYITFTQAAGITYVNVNITLAQLVNEIKAIKADLIPAEAEAIIAKVQANLTVKLGFTAEYDVKSLEVAVTAQSPVVSLETGEPVLDETKTANSSFRFYIDYSFNDPKLAKITSADYVDYSEMVQALLSSFGGGNEPAEITE